MPENFHSHWLPMANPVSNSEFVKHSLFSLGPSCHWITFWKESVRTERKPEGTFFWSVVSRPRESALLPDWIAISCRPSRHIDNSHGTTFAIPETKGDSDTYEGATTFVSRFLNPKFTLAWLSQAERNRFAPSDTNLIIELCNRCWITVV